MQPDEQDDMDAAIQVLSCETVSTTEYLEDGQVFLLLEEIMTVKLLIPSPQVHSAPAPSTVKVQPPAVSDNEQHVPLQTSCVWRSAHVESNV